MRATIDDMIDVISSDMLYFLEATNKKDLETFNYVSYLILISKILCVDMTLGIIAIDNFSDDFFEKINGMMIQIDDDIKSEKCYDYVIQFYHNLFAYLENNEEYEMCSNFRNFINAFNKKVDDLNSNEL